MADLHPLIFWTADRSALVEEGDVRAAFLAYAWNDPITPEHLALLGNKTAIAEMPTPAVSAPVKPAPRKTTTRKPARRR